MKNNFEWKFVYSKDSLLHLNICLKKKLYRITKFQNQYIQYQKFQSAQTCLFINKTHMCSL